MPVPMIPYTSWFGCRAPTAADQSTKVERQANYDLRVAGLVSMPRMQLSYVRLPAQMGYPWTTFCLLCGLVGSNLHGF